MATHSFATHRIQLISVYERNSDIRKRVFEFEKELAPFLRKPYKMLAVPDNENPEIPRFEAVDQKCNLSVNQVRTTFTQVFDQGTTIDLAKDLFQKRIDILKPLMMKEKLHFIAIIFDLKYYFNDNIEIFDIFKQFTNASVTKKTDIVEFSLFYARPFLDRYFLNVSNSRFEEVEINLKLREQVAEKKSKKLGIGVTLDMNTKLSFQNKLSFEEKLFQEITNHIFEVVNKKSLENYLSGDIDL